MLRYRLNFCFLRALGDSDASGYCKTGRVGEHPIDNSAWIPNRSDAWATWPSQLARALDAEVMVEAVGSAGYTSPAEQLLDPINLAAGETVFKVCEFVRGRTRERAD